MATPTFEISADSNVIKYYPQSPHNRHNIDSSTHHPDHRYLNQYPNHGIFYRGDISPNRVRSPSPNRPTRSSSPRFPSMGRFEGQRMASGSGAGRDISVQRIGQAVARRFVRTARRGNLPFIIIFVSCLWMFFSALAGVGYVDPETLVPTSGDAAFMPGAPVFDPVQAQEMALAKKVEEQRELERSWEKKKRPREGAWMRRQRDDKAIRRVPQPSFAVDEGYEVVYEDNQHVAEYFDSESSDDMQLDDQSGDRQVIYGENEEEGDWDESFRWDDYEGHEGEDEDGKDE